MIYGVNQEQVVNVWKEVEPLVEKGLKHARGEFDKYDVLAALVQQQMQLWVIQDEGQPINGICITQVDTYPKKRVAKIVLMVGDAFNGWFFEALER